MKAQRLKEGSNFAAGKASTQPPSIGEVSSPPATLWSDVSFDTLWFKSSHIPFPKSPLLITRPFVPNRPRPLWTWRIIFYGWHSCYRTSTKEDATKLWNRWRRRSRSRWMLTMRAKSCCSPSRKTRTSWEEKMTDVKPRPNKYLLRRNPCKNPWMSHSFPGRSWIKSFRSSPTRCCLLRASILNAPRSKFSSSTPIWIWVHGLSQSR